MKTSKSISTISYNTASFLVEKLEALRKAHYISFWFAMYHHAEADEKGHDHFHVYLEPARLLQTMDLEDEFIEFVPGEDKPRRVRPFRSSKIEEAFLYWLHDERYLASIGESRQYHYSIDEMLTSDSDELDEVSRIANKWFAEQYGKVDYVKEKIIQGLSDEQIVMELGMPVQYTLGSIAFVQNIRKAMTQAFSRNGHESHEEDGSQVNPG